MGAAFALAVAVGVGAAGVEASAWNFVGGSIRPGLGYLDFGTPVRTLQGDLAEFGYNPGVIDGYFGQMTLQGLMRFQRDQGLAPSGWLDKATYQSLLRTGGWGGWSGQSEQTGQTGTSQQQVLQMTATAYSASAAENWPYGPVDYFGAPLVMGDVAVDPSVVPLGTRLWVSGYNTPLLPQGGFEAIARDTGSAIRGSRIDIFIDQPASVVSNFGIQQVTVTVLGK